RAHGPDRRSFGAPAHAVRHRLRSQAPPRGHRTARRDPRAPPRSLLTLTHLRHRTTRVIASYVPCEETLSRRVPPARDTVTPTGRRSPLPAPARKTTGPTISGRLRVPWLAGKNRLVTVVGRNESEADGKSPAWSPGPRRIRRTASPKDPPGPRSPLPPPARKTTGPAIKGRLPVPSPAGKYPFVNCVGRNVSEGDR